MQPERIIILGASGIIGSQLFCNARKQGFNVIGTTMHKIIPELIQFDMTSQSISDFISDLSEKDIVFLLSAYTNPNWIFLNQDVSRSLNVDATVKVIDEIFMADAKLFFLSTELVFDGREGNYTETDTPNPSTLYAKQKVEVEEYIRHSQGKWCIIRTGATVSCNIEDNCAVTKTYLSLLNEGAKMAYDNVFTVTAVRDTSCLSLELAAKSKSGIYHIVSSPAISRTELADIIIKNCNYGMAMSFEPCTFDKISYSESRPKCSWLSNNKITAELNAVFLPPKEVVVNKVKLIDTWYAQKKTFEKNRN